MTTLTYQPSALVDQFEAAFTAMDGQVYVSQARCVDILLDLYCATYDDVVRHVLSDGLNEIRHVNLVRTSDMRACLLLAARSRPLVGGRHPVVRICRCDSDTKCR